MNTIAIEKQTGKTYVVVLQKATTQSPNKMGFDHKFMADDLSHLFNLGTKMNLNVVSENDMIEFTDSTKLSETSFGFTNFWEDNTANENAKLAEKSFAEFCEKIGEYFTIQN